MSNGKPCIFLLDKNKPKLSQGFHSAVSASLYLWGKKIDDYVCVIEKPSVGPIVVQFSDSNIAVIENEMRKHL